jgi:hypothetical protein
MVDIDAQVSQLTPCHYTLGTDVICFCETDVIGRLEVETLQPGFITGLSALRTTEEHSEACVEIRTMELPPAPYILLESDRCQRLVVTQPIWSKHFQFGDRFAKLSDRHVGRL